MNWSLMWQDLSRWTRKAAEKFADDWIENLVVLLVGVAFGRFGFPWFF